MRKDFHVYQPIQITAGQDVHLTLSSDNSLCGIEDEFHCLTIVVSMPVDGKVAAEAVPDDSQQRVSMSVDGPSNGGDRTGAVGKAGEAIKLVVSIDWTAPTAGVTARTSIVP